MMSWTPTYTPPKRPEFAFQPAFVHHLNNHRSVNSYVVRAYDDLTSSFRHGWLYSYAQTGHRSLLALLKVKWEASPGRRFAQSANRFRCTSQSSKIILLWSQYKLKCFVHLDLFSNTRRFGHIEALADLHPHTRHFHRTRTPTCLFAYYLRLIQRHMVKPKRNFEAVAPEQPITSWRHDCFDQHPTVVHPYSTSFTLHRAIALFYACLHTQR